MGQVQLESMVEEVSEIVDPEEHLPSACNEVSSIMAEVSNVFVDYDLCTALEEKAQISNHAIVNGVTTPHTDEFLLDDAIEEDGNGDEDSSHSSNDSIGEERDIDPDQVEDNFMNAILIGKIDPELYMTAEEENEDSEQCWSRTYPTANWYQFIEKDGLKWDEVKRRKTICLQTGQVIEDIKISKDLDDKFLACILPKGVNGIRTEFYFDVDSSVMAAHAKRSQGVSKEHLSKIWKISIDEAAKTIDGTSQNRVHTSDPKIAKSYGTNDRKLRYERLNEYFYMDTLIATSKGGKSLRGNTCGQLFVTNKGFVRFVAMNSRSEVILAMKQFAKEVGVPDAIICDAAEEHKSNAMRNFCHDIGTTLRLLERGTPWANKAELYIGIMKEAIRKDMRESDCPIRLWDYCFE